MVIDINEVLCYCKCPMLYKFKYVDETNNKNINILEKYDYDIHKTLYSYFAIIQNKEIGTLHALKKAWGEFWLKNKSPYDIIYSEPTSWRDTYDNKRKQGINAIFMFYQTFKDKPGIPIILNQKYKIAITKNITLTGTFELVRAVNIDDKDYIEIIDFKTNDRAYNKISINNDIEITAMSYAFRKIFNTKENNVIYYGIDKGKFESSTRSEADYDIMLNTISNVAKAIYNKMFYICPDEKCLSCPYKTKCSEHFS